jgi:Integrase core domain
VISKFGLNRCHLECVSRHLGRAYRRRRPQERPVALSIGEYALLLAFLDAPERPLFARVSVAGNLASRRHLRSQHRCSGASAAAQAGGGPEGTTCHQDRTRRWLCLQFRSNKAVGRIGAAYRKIVNGQGKALHACVRSLPCAELDQPRCARNLPRPGHHGRACHDRQRFVLQILFLPGRLQAPRPQAYPHQALYPKTNGKAERFIQTSLREWAYAQAYNTSKERAAELPRWLHRYNWHRPHPSIGSKPPISRLALAANNLLRLHI